MHQRPGDWTGEVYFLVPRVKVSADFSRQNFNCGGNLFWLVLKVCHALRTGRRSGLGLEHGVETWKRPWYCKRNKQACGCDDDDRDRDGESVYRSFRSVTQLKRLFQRNITFPSLT